MAKKLTAIATKVTDRAQAYFGLSWTTTKKSPPRRSLNKKHNLKAYTQHHGRSENVSNLDSI